MIPLSDIELLRLVAIRDRDALTTLYDRYARVVFAVALRILKTHTSAEDVLQDLFLHLWEHPIQLGFDQGTLHGWFVIAARNRSISVLRKRIPDSLNDRVLKSPERLEDAIHCKLLCDQLIDRIPSELQTLLKLAFKQDMTQSEIAAATGVPLGTVKTRVRSALAAMREVKAVSARV